MVGLHYSQGLLFTGSAILETQPYLGPNPIHRVPPGLRTSITLALTLTLTLTLGIEDPGNGEPWEW